MAAKVIVHKIEFENDQKPNNLANSAVLRMLEEEEAAKRGGRGSNNYHRARQMYPKLDRDTVLKINRGHRRIRDSSWPPKFNQNYNNNIENNDGINIKIDETHIKIPSSHNLKNRQNIDDTKILFDVKDIKRGIQNVPKITLSCESVYETSSLLSRDIHRTPSFLQNKCYQKAFYLPNDKYNFGYCRPIKSFWECGKSQSQENISTTLKTMTPLKIADDSQLNEKCMSLTDLKPPPSPDSLRRRYRFNNVGKIRSSDIDNDYRVCKKVEHKIFKNRKSKKFNLSELEQRQQNSQRGQPRLSALPTPIQPQSPPPPPPPQPSVSELVAQKIHYNLHLLLSDENSTKDKNIKTTTRMTKPTTQQNVINKNENSSGIFKDVVENDIEMSKCCINNFQIINKPGDINHVEINKKITELPTNNKCFMTNTNSSDDKDNFLILGNYQENIVKETHSLLPTEKTIGLNGTKNNEHNVGENGYPNKTNQKIAINESIRKNKDNKRPASPTAKQNNVVFDEHKKETTEIDAQLLSSTSSPPLTRFDQGQHFRQNNKLKPSDGGNHTEISGSNENLKKLSKRLIRETEKNLNNFEVNLEHQTLDTLDDCERQQICENLITLETSILDLIEIIRDSLNTAKNPQTSENNFKDLINYSSPNYERQQVQQLNDGSNISGGWQYDDTNVDECKSIEIEKDNIAEENSKDNNLIWANSFRKGDLTTVYDNVEDDNMIPSLIIEETFHKNHDDNVGFVDEEQKKLQDFRNLHKPSSSSSSNEVIVVAAVHDDEDDRNKYINMMGDDNFQHVHKKYNEPLIIDHLLDNHSNEKTTTVINKDYYNNNNFIDNNNDGGIILDDDASTEMCEKYKNGYLKIDNDFYANNKFYQNQSHDDYYKDDIRKMNDVLFTSSVFCKSNSLPPPQTVSYDFLNDSPYCADDVEHENENYGVCMNRNEIENHTESCLKSNDELLMMRKRNDREMKTIQSSHDRFWGSPRLFMTGHFDRTEGLKKVAWPPVSDSSPVRNVVQPPQQQYQQPQESNYSQQPRSVTPNPNYTLENSNSYHQAPQHQAQHQHQAQQYHPEPHQQPHYQTQHQSRPVVRTGSQPPYQQQYSSPSQQPSYVNRQPSAPTTRPAFIKSPGATTAFCGGIPVRERTPSAQPTFARSITPQPNYQSQAPQHHQQAQYQPPQSQYQAPQQQQQHYQQPQQHYNTTPSTAPLSPLDISVHSQGSSPRGWSHVDPSQPIDYPVGAYTRQRSNEPTHNQFNNRFNQSGVANAPQSTSSYQDQGQYQQPQSQVYQPVSYNQPAEYQQQQQYNQPGFQQQQQPQQQYQQPQQQFQQNQQFNQPQQSYSNSNVRQQSPGYITLRDSAPVSQQPAPVYTSQPATARFRGGSTMRGDQKWPPEGVKTPADLENERRKLLAAGPTCRPRRLNKDYSGFFAQHALNNAYPGYRAPPGTQHYGYGTPY